jgi:hypothetical protein
LSAGGGAADEDLVPLRVVPIVCGLLLALTAPAAAHVRTAETHRDTRFELRHVDIAETVETVEEAAGTEGEALPEQWCGVERTTDDTVNAAFELSQPQFKVVYAYPSDRPNNFAAWRDAIQANVSLIGRFMGAQSGGRRAPRIDMGTSCGLDYVDIQVVPLPLERIHYEDDFDRLEAAVRAQFTHAADHRRNVVVFADGLSSLPPGHWWGLGSSWLDDSHGAGNISNHGDLFSALWIPDGEPVPAAGADGWWPEGMLHEMTHNLGAVQDSAPSSTLNGHCTDGFDVMCYADGGPVPYVPGVCAEIEGVMTQVYDCGNDDYFNVAPPAGSYLATKWNVYDNAYLGSCFALAPACGAEGMAIPNLPVATADPTVQGSATVGRVLTSGIGSWINDPGTFDLQWQRGDGATWTDIPGATYASYAVSAADAGQRLRIQVVASNADGSTVAVSAPTAVVTAPATVSTPAAAPSGVQPLPTGPGTPPVVAGTSSGSAALKVAVGKGRGRRLATIAFSVANGRLQTRRTRLRLAKGRYDVTLCTTAGASTTTPRCVTRRLRVKRARKVATPALSVPVPAGAEGRVSYAVTAIGRLFAARTAKRPALGLLLRG